MSSAFRLPSQLDRGGISAAEHLLQDRDGLVGVHVHQRAERGGPHTLILLAARPRRLLRDRVVLQYPGVEDEVVARLNRQLGREDEDRVAILTAPHGLGGVAVLRYAAERILKSAPENIQELRERGCLPEPWSSDE